VVVDETGVETVVAMDELMQVGVLGAGGKGDESGKPLYMQMHRVRSGNQTAP
jgi:hypothetical protein